MKPESQREPESDFPVRLSNPARRALVLAGYLHLEQLAGLQESEIGRLHGVGPNALAKLRAALAERGLAFADDPAKGKP